MVSQSDHNRSEDTLTFKPTKTTSDINPNSSKLRSLRRILKATLLYFAIVFAVGCVLGPIRILWAVPRFGTRMAELMEMPFMLVAIILAAHWVMRWLTIPLTLRARLGVGMGALGCLLIAEFGAVLQLRGVSVVEYVATRDPIAGAVYYVMLCMFAVMPWLVARDVS